MANFAGSLCLNVLKIEKIKARFSLKWNPMLYKNGTPRIIAGKARFGRTENYTYVQNIFVFLRTILSPILP